METLQQFLQYLLHIDTYLFSFVANYGVLTYIMLFAIIFCETGLVVTPFLPGDSLIFAAGSIAAHDSGVLSINLLFVLLFIASVIGNKLNYFIGRMIGPRIFVARNSMFLNKNHLHKAHEFYERHGGKTIILARFIPIIRTFAPFIAGVGYMTVSKFTVYNLISAFIWIGSLLGAGYFFGNLPIVKENFSIVIYGIIALSLLPPALAFVYRSFKTT